jgi:hypothetical protein
VKVSKTNGQLLPFFFFFSTIMVHVMDICPTNSYHEKVAYVLTFIMTNVLAMVYGGLHTLRLSLNL